MDNMKLKSNTEDRTRSEGTRLQEIKRRNPTQTTSLDYFPPKPPLKGGSQTLEDESQRLLKRTQTPSKKKKQIQELLEDFDPLKLMLNYASPSEEKHWKKLAKQAHTKPLSGIKLHCIDCCGGYRKEAARCDIRTCALWPPRWKRTALTGIWS